MRARSLTEKVSLDTLGVARSLGPSRVLVVSGDYGFRAGLAIALESRTRVYVGAHISVSLQLASTVKPDLVIIDLRRVGTEDVLTLDNLRARVRRGTFIVVGSGELLEHVLRPTVGRAEIPLTEPVDLARLFVEVGAVLGPRSHEKPSVWLSQPSIRAVGRVVADFGSRNLCVHQLSRSARLSSDHFAHLFRKDMGIAPMEYVRRVRARAAVYMLTETSSKVSAVAERAGFYDGPHLAVVLRQLGFGRPRDMRPRVDR